MKKQNKKLNVFSALILTTLLLSATEAKAQEAETPKTEENCAEIKEACTDALHAAEVLLNVQDAVIKEQDEALKGLLLSKDAVEKRALELEQSNKAWYRSPFLYLGIGLITGAIIAK